MLKRYGTNCAFCSIKRSDLLDAAHIYPKSKLGTDDPRNGIPLCPLHHRVFDNGFAVINPVNYEIEYRKQGPFAEEMNITKKSINHLKNKPHKEALSKIYEDWLRKNK